MSFREKMENNRGILTIVVLIAVGALLLIGWFGTKITADDDFLRITGLHGRKLPYDEIASVELIEKLPAITSRTGGYSLGGKKLGNFMTTEYGAVKLYLQNGEKPFIFITGTDGKLYFLNTTEPEQTNDLFDNIMDRMD
ncbi:MAG TPA: PH domain-containing protein [Clostridia bacterium]|nr:PH domain-containing protein [Clostridia bacterium]HPQ47772.1 PH domain-containing protein [Clostridia bacterium]